MTKELVQRFMAASDMVQSYVDFMCDRLDELGEADGVKKMEFKKALLEYQPKGVEETGAKAMVLYILDDPDQEELTFYTNYYKCSECGEEWQNEDDCTCNDRCPVCDNEITPYKSEEIDDEE